jgi:hypothetical protein
MSKLALMYACADCFQWMSKRKEPRQSEEVELRTHTGIGRTRSLWGKEQDSHGKTERDSGKPHLQDRSVHGLEHHHAEDHGDQLLSQVIKTPSDVHCTSIVTSLTIFSLLSVRRDLKSSDHSCLSLQTPTSPPIWPGRSVWTKWAGTIL